MKRTLIGCWLTLLGTLWGAGVLFAASQMLVNSWDPAIGHLLSNILKKQLLFSLKISVHGLMIIQMFRT